MGELYTHPTRMQPQAFQENHKWTVSFLFDVALDFVEPFDRLILPFTELGELAEVGCGALIRLSIYADELNNVERKIQLT